MAKFRVERKYEKNAEQVWKAFDDFGGIYKFHPAVEFSKTTNEINTGLGAERECQFKDGGAVQERITKYSEGKEMEVEIFETGKFPIKSAVANIQVANTLDGSKVVFEMEFHPKFGPLGWVMGELLMKPKFRSLITDVLDELDPYLDKSGDGIRGKAKLAVA